MVRRWSSAAARRLIAAAGDTSDVLCAVETITSRLREDADCPADAPTDLNAVATKLGVKGWVAADLPVAGELRRDGDTFVIAYASGMPAGRRRFTIAHELGHAFFESTGPGCPRVGEELELICDRFAAALLLPADSLRAALGNWSPHIAIELASRYNVSLSAMILRAEEVGDRHAAILDPGGAINVATAMIGGKRGIQRKDLVPIAARAIDGVAGLVLLPQNRRWNGEWRVEGEVLAGGQRVLVTGIPIDVSGKPIDRRLPKSALAHQSRK